MENDDDDKYLHLPINNANSPQHYPNKKQEENQFISLIRIFKFQAAVSNKIREAKLHCVHYPALALRKNAFGLSLR